MNEIVSVIIPVYNVEKYIEECTRSIINQTYKNLEIILVDDGSTDGSGQACDMIMNEDGRIRVLHKENGGLSSARNAGIEAASGDFLYFLDSDDLISYSAIEILLNEIQNNDADIAIGDMVRTSSRTIEVCDKYESNSLLMHSEEALIEMCYGRKYSTSACGKLFKRELFDDIRFPDGKFSEDLFTVYKTILKSKIILYSNEAKYYYYYRNEGSIVVSKYSIKHLEAIEAVDLILRDVGNINITTAVKNAIATMYLNVIYDIAARCPTREEFSDRIIQEPLKRSRLSVLKNAKAPYRLRLFAFLTYFGSSFAIGLVFVYNRLKWKIARLIIN